MKKLQIIGLITALVLTSGLVGCKEQPVQEEIEDPETTESYDYKPTVQRIGSEFWESYKEQDITSMANLSADYTRENFIIEAQRYFNNKFDWENEFFQTNLEKLAVVNGDYEIHEDTAQVEYTLLLSDYDYQYFPGELTSYKVTLKFDLADEDACVSNPEAAVDLYKDVLNDYDRYLINTKVFPDETEPEETIPPETTEETTVATETTPEETISTETTGETTTETTAEETSASELETSETTKKKKKKKKEVVVSDDENEPGEY